MTQKEKKLVGIFLAVLAVVIVAQGIPFAFKAYNSGLDDIDELKHKISRLKRLQAREDYWRLEFEKNNKRKQVLQKMLFVGKSPELVAARVQGSLKALAIRSGINVDSMSLPELKQRDDWLLVNQSMSFKATSAQLMQVLDLIRKSNPSLVVVDVQVRSHRLLLSCTLKVVGFSRVLTAQESNSK